MERIGREVLVVAIAIILLIVAWEVFKFLFWIIIWAIIFVIAYRAVKWAYNSLFGSKNHNTTYENDL